MSKVYIDFVDENGKPIRQDDILTSGDAAYVFDDISNYVHKDGEFSNVPEGTKEIRIRIPCLM